MYLLTKFQSDAQREIYDDFPQVSCLECNLGACKKANFLRSYLYKYSAKALLFSYFCLVLDLNFAHVSSPL